MTKLSYLDALSVPVLIFYGPCLILSILLIFRHGWQQSGWTWFVLTTFSLTRLLYAALTLAAHTHATQPGLRAAAATLAVDGLSPLLLMSLGLVHRLRDFIRHSHPGAFALSGTSLLRRDCLRLVELLLAAAFICASVGYRGLSRDEILHGVARHSDTLKAAAAMYVVACAGVVAAAGELAARFCACVLRGERRVLVVLVGGLPLLCVRTVYLAVDVLGDVSAFSATSGNPTLFLCLGLLPEMVVSAVYVALGWVVRVLSREEWREMQEDLENEETGKADGGNAAMGSGRTDVDLESGRGRAGNT